MPREPTQNSKKTQLLKESKLKIICVLYVSAVIKSCFNLVVFALIVTTKQKAMKNL